MLQLLGILLYTKQFEIKIENRLYKRLNYNNEAEYEERLKGF